MSLPGVTGFMSYSWVGRQASFIRWKCFLWTENRRCAGPQGMSKLHEDKARAWLVSVITWRVLDDQLNEEEEA